MLRVVLCVALVCLVAGGAEEKPVKTVVPAWLKSVAPAAEDTVKPVEAASSAEDAKLAAESEAAVRSNDASSSAASSSGSSSSASSASLASSSSASSVSSSSSSSSSASSSSASSSSASVSAAAAVKAEGPSDASAAAGETEPQSVELRLDLAATENVNVDDSEPKAVEVQLDGEEKAGEPLRLESVKVKLDKDGNTTQTEEITKESAPEDPLEHLIERVRAAAKDPGDALHSRLKALTGQLRHHVRHHVKGDTLRKKAKKTGHKLGRLLGQLMAGREDEGSVTVDEEIIPEGEMVDDEYFEGSLPYYVRDEDSFDARLKPFRGRGRLGGRGGRGRGGRRGGRMPGPGFPRIFFGGRGQWGPSGGGSKRSQMPEAIKHFLGLDMTAPEDHEDVDVIFEPEAQISEEDGSEE
mmetsp:Transcript_21046/g.45650  ORF Transcript_21046/g.45650 Transcript_21046/m.45650 type:complete len:411 (+) Transcript_21046:18-1250(+)